MELFCPIVILSVLASSEAVGFHGFHFKGLEEPSWLGSRTITEKWIEQTLDHFNHRDDRTWNMRYYEEDRYFNGTGPILVFLGGEWEISPGYLNSGLMYEIGKQHGALMFYTEHRYYGKSEPTKNLSSANMQYLSVDQALADVAYFVKEKKAEREAEDAKVVVFGGSYSGNMAAWMRIKYPHLIQGAVASSAPVYAKADFYEYYETVTEALKRHGDECVASVKVAIEQTEEMLASQAGAEMIQILFNLCSAVNVTSRNEVSYFMNYVAEKFAGAVQYNKGGVGRNSTIGGLCATMADKKIGAPVKRLATLFKKESCTKDADYSNFLETMRSEKFEPSEATRQWFFQTCTEYGYYQTTNSSRSVFGTLFELDFFVDLCQNLYGEYYDKNLLEYGVSRTNIQYGGRLPDVTNVIFTNGDVDPWHRLSVLEDLNESSPAILISGTSHCEDLKSSKSARTSPELEGARKRVNKLVSTWLI
ncbi:putative serine protease K12H4.7 [Copidosoma floridanum]|uniref:putative serine protease K12H4.7 n=1 Tax=Copidosoma floridanum TaxID=29053 RepID=UPI0006C9C8CA|nr:putative serine protease K12H4.7 [Copidosoma floridanum]